LDVSSEVNRIEPELFARIPEKEMHEESQELLDTRPGWNSSEVFLAAIESRLPMHASQFKETFL
jgi:hypothetical protein